MRVLVALAVLVAHACAIGICLITGDFDSNRPVEAPARTAVLVQITGQAESQDTAPLPDVALVSVMLRERNLVSLRFEDLDAGDVAGVIGKSSVPRLSRMQSVDVADFARRAGVRPGDPMTVVLTIEVLQNGSVGEVQLVRSCGTLSADSAAVDYARSLQWTPATFDGVARRVRIRFPVVLSIESVRATD
ncbi:MAG: TonB family protein [Gammaproteobacteria bacterium]